MASEQSGLSRNGYAQVGLYHDIYPVVVPWLEVALFARIDGAACTIEAEADAGFAGGLCVPFHSLAWFELRQMPGKARAGNHHIGEGILGKIPQDDSGQWIGDRGTL